MLKNLSLSTITTAHLETLGFFQGKCPKFRITPFEPPMRCSARHQPVPQEFWAEVVIGGGGALC